MIYTVLFVVLVIVVALLLLPLAAMNDQILFDSQNNGLGGLNSPQTWLDRYYQAWIKMYSGTPLSPQGSTWPFWVLIALLIYTWTKMKKK